MKITENQKVDLIRKAIAFGESLMPCDCADIIAAKFELERRMKLGQRALARMIVMMMECSDFVCDFEDAFEEAEYLV
ncbi:MAG: hypothetical protein EOM73_15790 [Bacteroidia bacterium]|nr:hypothetical protein [Bacteroidia bacterium]